MTAQINANGEITTITPGQEAALAKATPLIGCGLPAAYDGYGDTSWFIYTDPRGEEADLRLILNADGAFVDLDMWANEEQTRAEADGMYDSDWASIDGGDLGEQIQAALKA